jgi:pimeloyl-ACP methyl ester carboxylesterase
MNRRPGLGISCSFLLLCASGLYAEDGFFDSNGVKLHYTVQGKGEPVVLIHGFSVNSEVQWSLPGIAKALAREHEVICLDCRGHGRSGKPHDPAMYGNEMVEDVVRLLDHLKINKAHVVGYSMGGFITLKFLALHPDRLLSATTGGAGWTRKVDSKFLNDLADALQQGKGMELLLTRLAARGQPPPDAEQLQTANRFMVLFNDPKALSAVMRALKNLAFPEQDLKTNQVPTLALVGDRDPLKDQIDEMAAVMAHLQVVVIKGADHMNAFSRPEFTRSLVSFIDHHAEGGSVRQEAVSAGGQSH